MTALARSDSAAAPTLDQASALASAVIEAVETGSSAALGQALSALEPDERAAAASVALLPAASSGRSRLVRQLLDAGASPDVRGEGRVTALMLAASSGSGEAVQWLCEAGADPNLSDDRGERALDHAERAGADEAKRLLLAWGATASSPKRPSPAARAPAPPAQAPAPPAQAPAPPAQASPLVVRPPSLMDLLVGDRSWGQVLAGTVIAIGIVVAVLLADAAGLLR